MRGWLPFYGASVRLGARYLLRRGYLREAVIRVVIPLEPLRYAELPWALRSLHSAAGSRILDLASPKLLPVLLARRGSFVTSVDEFAAEIETWRALTRGEPNLELVVADGRSLPFEDASFDHATCISVLEHVADNGDAQALAELARCVRPGGRIIVTLPFANRAWDEYRGTAAYLDRGSSEHGHFFQRWYDDRRVDALLASVPAVSEIERSVAQLLPNWSRAYTRTFPLLVPLGPFFGLLALERAGPGGDVVRLVLERG